MSLQQFFRAALVGILAVVANGCATYSNKFQPIERALASGKPDIALKALDDAYESKGVDAPLYYLNKGILLRLNKRYAESNVALEEAKGLIDEAEAISITEQAKTGLINDAVRTYEGEDFEKVLLHFYKAFNYLDLQQPDNARVEVLQVDVKINALTSKANGSALTEEAFARYLGGIIFENRGEWSDAMIEYRKAYEAFKLYQKKYNVPLPESLKYALVRLAERQGIEDELKKYREEFGLKDWPSVASRAANGELVLTLHNGLVAIKDETATQAPEPGSNRFIRVALPVYRPRTLEVTQARLRIGDQTVRLDIVEDVSALAIKSLESHMSTITGRAVARAIAKREATKTAEKGSAIAGLVVNIAGVVSERADTRSWSSLPAQIHLGRVSLAPGKYQAQLELLDRTGKVLHTQNFTDVTVTQGQATYVTYHWTS